MHTKQNNYLDDENSYAALEMVKMKMVCRTL